jgi:hypothetical protein
MSVAEMNRFILSVVSLDMGEAGRERLWWLGNIGGDLYHAIE